MRAQAKANLCLCLVGLGCCQFPVEVRFQKQMELELKEQSARKKYCVGTLTPSQKSHQKVLDQILLVSRKTEIQNKIASFAFLKFLGTNREIDHFVIFNPQTLHVRNSTNRLVITNLNPKGPWSPMKMDYSHTNIPPKSLPSPRPHIPLTDLEEWESE